MTWHKQAACLGAPIGMFYIEQGKNATEARAICDTCPVTEPCLDHALRHESFGIWAGTSENQRRVLRHERGIVVEAPDTLKPVAVCGTTGGYRSHLYHGEPVCDQCLQAKREYQRHLRASKKDDAA